MMNKIFGWRVKEIVNGFCTMFSKDGKQCISPNYCNSETTLEKEMEEGRLQNKDLRAK